MSIVVPFISLDVFPNEIILPGSKNANSDPIIISDIHRINWYFTVYIIGFTISFILFVYRLLKIINLIRSIDFESYFNYKLKNNYSRTFSFWKHIFIEDKNNFTLLSHEIVHISKYHTIDKIIAEVSTCIIWFNPLIYRFRFYIMENHEFEADNLSIKAGNIQNIDLAEFLLQYTKSKNHKSLTLFHEFNSLTKNRIKMLAKTKFKSSQVYLFMIPLFFIIFSAFSFKSYPVYITDEGKIVHDTLIPGNIIITDTVVVFDPESQNEYTVFVENEKPLEDILKKIHLSGKTWETIDTVVLFDPDTYTETMEVYKNIIPVEFKEIYSRANWKQQRAILKEYGKTIKLPVK